MRHCITEIGFSSSPTFLISAFEAVYSAAAYFVFAIPAFVGSFFAAARFPNSHNSYMLTTSPGKIFPNGHIQPVLPKARPPIRKLDCTPNTANLSMWNVAANLMILATGPQVSLNLTDIVNFSGSEAYSLGIR